MPELPEVQTVIDTLKNLILDKKIVDIKVYYKSIIEGDVACFIKQVNNHIIKDIKRRGKYIIFELDNDITFYSHLRMEGKYFVQNENESINKHIHVVFKFEDGIELRYQDTRKFGRMALIKRDDYKVFRNLGVEPFDSNFNFDYCKKILNNKKKSIKNVLLDQSFIAGIGNIYADEILFKMAVNPLTLANELNDNNIMDLITYTNEILAKAIEAGGTTIRSYTSSLGVTGLFQINLNVHAKEGEKCPRCQNSIKKITVGGRGTYYCPICQK